MEATIPLSARFFAKKSRLGIKLKAMMDKRRYQAAPNKTYVVGAYNTSNVGDLTFRWVLEKLAREENHSFGFLSFNQLQANLPPPSLILGGGGVIYLKKGSPFEKILSLYQHRPEAVGIIGGSGDLHQSELNETYLNFMTKLRFFSTRSESERRSYASCKITNAVLQPDIAFALPLTHQLKLSPRRGEKCLGINVSPFLATIGKNKIASAAAPSDWFKQHVPDQAAVFTEIMDAYVTLVRSAIENYSKRGWKIRAISMAVEDDLFARACFAGAPLEIVPFRADPIYVLQKMSECEKFLATRFHSHIFSMLVGIPFLSLAYAPKCQFLYDELNLDPTGRLDMVQLVQNPQAALETLMEHPGSKIDGRLLNEVQQKSLSMTRMGLKAFC